MGAVRALRCGDVPWRCRAAGIDKGAHGPIFVPPAHGQEWLYEHHHGTGLKFRPSRIRRHMSCPARAGIGRVFNGRICHTGKFPPPRPGSRPPRRPVHLHVGGAKANALVKTVVVTAFGKESGGEMRNLALPFDPDRTLPEEPPSPRSWCWASMLPEPLGTSHAPSRSTEKKWPGGHRTTTNRPNAFSSKRAPSSIPDEEGRQRAAERLQLV